MANYFFNQKCANEMDAFTKYFDAIQQNGYIHSIIKEVNNMNDACDLYPEASGHFFTHQLNVYHGSLEESDHNAEILCASKTLKLRVTKDKGRHLVANRSIAKHKVIVSEYPTVLQVRPACICFGKQITGIYRCHECGMSCRLFFICDDCNIAIFCTKECRRRAMIYHKYECYGFQRHFWPMDVTEYSYIAFRMMLYGVSRQFNTKENPLKYGDEDNNYPAIFQLKSNFRNVPLIKLNEILYASARSLLYLINHTNFFKQFEELYSKVDEIHRYIGGLLVKHYCQAQINSVLLNFTNFFNGYGFDVPIGFGKAICPTIALFNHSCSPNAVLMPSMNSVIVKTLRRIREGEELTICYSEISSFMKLEERKLISEQLFNFTCSCSFCEFETDMVDAPYKCEFCILGLVTEIPSNTEDPMGQCIRCARTYNIRRAKLFHQSSQIYRAMYWKSRSLQTLKQTAYCLEEVFPRSSIYLLDVYKEMYKKYCHLKVHPTETIKYGLLAFSVMNTFIPRTNVRYLVSKLNFFKKVIDSKEFSGMTMINDKEYNDLKDFMYEVMKTKKDILFYIPSDRAMFYQRLLLKLEQKVEELFGAYNS